MTDTGQVPGEGLPENAGMVEQPGVLAPGAYTYLDHSDTPAEEDGKGRFEVVNNDARMSVQSLSDFASSSVTPTIVETELYSKTISRPKQRGYHISLKSAKEKDNVFLTAIHIGTKEDSPGNFTATTLAPNKVKFSDGSSTCIIWLKGAAELEGDYGFVLYDKDQRIKAAGVHGVSLKSPEIEIVLKDEGSVTMGANSQGGLATETIEPQSNKLLGITGSDRNQ